jgi:hypothetical protein
MSIQNDPNLVSKQEAVKTYFETYKYFVRERLGKTVKISGMK